MELLLDEAACIAIEAIRTRSGTTMRPAWHRSAWVQTKLVNGQSAIAGT